MASGVKVSKMNFELNPRGNLWFNDESTFGHKLLAKMGWSKGKGLGKNEDGIKENIKISKKDSNCGVGWKNDEIPVAVGCLEYENILQNLQKHFKNDREMSDANERYEKSLEQRSRSARNHLHYQKFVRVKDLNRYSEKDMKSIFLEKPMKPVSEHPARPPQTPTFNSQLSVSDYFAQKMQKKKEEMSKSESKVSTEVNLSAQSQPSGQNFSKKRKLISESPETERGQKSKTRKKNTYEEASSVNDDISTEKSSGSEESSQRQKSKTKKKNTYEETSSVNNDISTEKSSGSEESSQRQKSKTKKKNNEETSSVSNDISTKKSSGSEESSQRQKSKRRKKNTDEEASSVNDDISTEKSSGSEESSQRQKKKKSKKKRLQQLKSCLKSRADYDLEKTRNVSFNEQVSYKVLDTSLELCEDLADEKPNEAADEELPTLVDSDEVCDHEVSNSSNNYETNEEDVFVDDEVSCPQEEESETEERPQCFDLPKCSGTNFNFWLESQRQASKMKLYKEMVKKIKKNKILRSTNLLDIKGYGNWGL